MSTSDNEPAAADPAVVTDHSRPFDGGATLSEVLAGYAGGGYTGSFTPLEGGSVECHSCNSKTSASRVKMSSLRRMEGASDPDDMVAVVAIECPSCNAKGTLVLGFGPTASEEDSDVLHCLQDFRSDSNAPGNSAPGEASGDAPEDATAGDGRGTPTAR
jgi:hypothetical protein